MEAGVLAGAQLLINLLDTPKAEGKCRVVGLQFGKVKVNVQSLLVRYSGLPQVVLHDDDTLNNNTIIRSRSKASKKCYR
jgi:hypothetical protein